MPSKNVINKKCAPKLIFFNEKKIEKDSDNFWYRKLTLKVGRLCHLCHIIPTLCYFLIYIFFRNQNPVTWGPLVYYSTTFRSRKEKVSNFVILFCTNFELILWFWSVNPLKYFRRFLLVSKTFPGYLDLEVQICFFW
jgi:hypothetical protein